MTEFNQAINDDERKLAKNLLEGGLVGQVRTLGRIDQIFSDLLKHEDFLAESMIKFIREGENFQDNLYSDADNIIMKSPEFKEDDDEDRDRMINLLDKKLTDITAALEGVYYPAEAR